MRKIPSSEKHKKTKSVKNGKLKTADFPQELTLCNRQRAVKEDWGKIREQAVFSLNAIREAAQPGAEIFAFSCIEVTIVSDKTISAIHRDFCGDPTPTDVITFGGTGEIILGAETIAANARYFGSVSKREFLLCIIHGLLHLAGWKDDTPAHFRNMKTRQEKILADVLNRIRKC